jgi:hypothetical protein
MWAEGWLLGGREAFFPDKWWEGLQGGKEAASALLSFSSCPWLSTAFGGPCRPVCRRVLLISQCAMRMERQRARREAGGRRNDWNSISSSSPLHARDQQGERVRVKT